MMTRKRFIKLLMSQGYDRNGANEIADKVRESKIPYANGYKYHQETKRVLQEVLPKIQEAVYDIVPKLANALASTMEAVKIAAAKCAEGFSAFAERYRNAMSETE